MISLPIFTENMKFFAWTFLNSSKIGRWNVLKNVGMQSGKKNKQHCIVRIQNLIIDCFSGGAEDSCVQRGVQGCWSGRCLLCQARKGEFTKNYDICAILSENFSVRWKNMKLILILLRQKYIYVTSLLFFGVQPHFLVLSKCSPGAKGDFYWAQTLSM